MPERDTTKRTAKASKMNEKEYAQYKYDRALKRMLENPTPDNVKAFEEANTYLYEIQDVYHIALKLLAERARNLLNAIFGLNKH